MPDEKNSFVAIQAPNQPRVRASLVHRGLQEIASIQQGSLRVVAPPVDRDQFSIVVKVNTHWIVRADRVPGKTYVMFGCEVENNSDNQQHLSKEMAIWRRSKSNGNLSYIGDAIMLLFSPELALPPQSATSLDLELEMDSPEENSGEYPVSDLLNDMYELLGYDYTFETAVLILS